MSRDMTKPTKWVCAQWWEISLGIRPVWSVFFVRMKKPWVHSYPLSAQRRLWSDWADAQADLSSLGEHSFCWFCHVAAHYILKISISFHCFLSLDKYEWLLFHNLNVFREPQPCCISNLQPFCSNVRFCFQMVVDCQIFSLLLSCSRITNLRRKGTKILISVRLCSFRHMIIHFKYSRKAITSTITDWASPRHEIGVIYCTTLRKSTEAEGWLSECAL